jgi:hypothetical protein
MAEPCRANEDYTGQSRASCRPCSPHIRGLCLTITPRTSTLRDVMSYGATSSTTSKTTRRCHILPNPTDTVTAKSGPARNKLVTIHTCGYFTLVCPGRGCRFRGTSFNLQIPSPSRSSHHYAIWTQATQLREASPLWWQLRWMGGMPERSSTYFLFSESDKCTRTWGKLSKRCSYGPTLINHKPQT